MAEAQSMTTTAWSLRWRLSSIGLLAALVLLASPNRAAAAFECSGDCNGDRRVSPLELSALLPAIFDRDELSDCDEAAAGSTPIAAARIVEALRASVDGCPSAPLACNDDERLCERRFDQVSFVTTHNAMANSQDGFTGPNQTGGVTRQLNDGVRALMLDTYVFEGEVQLCHADCAFFGHRPLVETLAEIRAFLERRPRDVVSIIFEDYVGAAAAEPAFQAAGLMEYVHAQPPEEPWPSLEQMIESGRRLVVFSDNRRDARPWYHYVWDYAFETPFSFERPMDLVCTPNRGNPGHSLFILNHFLTRGLGHPSLARLINFDPFFMNRARQCESENDRLPNFVTVDFYELGDTNRVVRTLNGLEP